MKRIFLFAMLLTSLLSIGQIVDFEKGTNQAVSHKDITGHSPRAYALRDYASTRKVSYIKQSTTDIPSDKVEIIVEAHQVFGEFAQIGFQMLLDKDHSTYGDIFYDWSQAFYDTYSEFEYKVPENADANENSKNVLIDGELSIMIPAGVYDFMFIYPCPGDGLMLAKGDFSRFDDFKFQGGCSYRFLIEYGPFEMPDFSGYDAVVNLFAKTDAAITDILLPIKGMDFTDQEDITIEILNRGSEDINNILVGYQIDGTTTVMERANVTIAPGDTINYTFKKKANFSAEKLYEVKAWSILSKDMITSNDTCVVKCNHQGVSQLPYFCDFSTLGAESIIYDWTVQDANNDNYTWMYSEWVKGVDGTNGVASCSGSLARDEYGNDNLISIPLYLNKGDNHMILYTKCVNDEKTELLNVAYGTTTQYEEMTHLAYYEVASLEWIKRVINFNVPQSGIYYFAFNACSLNGYNLFIDDITIGEGYYEVSPLLRVDKVVLPYSNCDRSENSIIGAKITNIGTGPTSEFTLTYTVDYDPSVSQKFTDQLLPTETKIYYFDQTADFSEIGKYEVLVEATCNTEIEGAELGEVHHFEPITQLPITTNFMTGENYSSCWTEMTPDTWILDEFGTFVSDEHGLENGLLSHCFALTGSIRIKLQYMKSGWETGRMYIACGKADADVSTYKKVYEDNDITDVMEVEFDVIIDDPDNYSFVIVNASDEYVSLCLGEMTISEYLSYDIKLHNVISPINTLTPQVQFSDDMTFHATVINRGSAPMTNVKASLYHKNELLATTTDGVKVSIGDTVSIPVTASIPYPAIGDKLDFTIKVAGDEADGYEGDNIYNIPTALVSDTVFATENKKTITNGTGMSGGQIFIGNLYELAVADVLSSVKVGWAYAGDPNDPVVTMPISIAIYEVNDDLTISRCLYQTENHNRGMGGWTDYKLPPMLLNPGRYYFEVQQLGIYNMGIGAIAGNDKYCYRNIDGTLSHVPGATLMIRANFAHDVVANNYDAAVVKFVAPHKPAALFTSDETIVATIRNMGAMAIEFPVTCQVNNEEYTQQLSLKPYEQVNVEFKHIDMASVGSYNISISTALDGDENSYNNTLNRTLYTIEEANPYVMNFEHCYDFDAAPDQFNPRWRTVECTGQETDYYWEYEYQYRGEPVGFIAFNPDATKPVATNRLLGFYPHSGKRFGAAFCVGYFSNVSYSDSWLISPQLSLSTNSSLELYVKTRYVESDGKEECYAILISDTDDNLESFKVLGDSVRYAPQPEWSKVEVDLSEYDNKDVYVAIRYIGERLKNVCLMVDDIMVKGDGIDTDGVASVNNDNAHITYNAVEDVVSVTAPNITHVELYDLQGRVLHTASVNAKDNYRMSVASLNSGVYVVRATTLEGITTTKISIQ